MTLNFNHDEHMLRALADIGSSRSITLESYNSKDNIKHSKDNKTT